MLAGKFNQSIGFCGLLTATLSRLLASSAVIFTGDTSRDSEIRPIDRSGASAPTLNSATCFGLHHRTQLRGPRYSSMSDRSSAVATSRESAHDETSGVIHAHQGVVVMCAFGVMHSWPKLTSYLPKPMSVGRSCRAALFDGAMGAHFLIGLRSRSSIASPT
jgi:hypothetical protein